MEDESRISEDSLEKRFLENYSEWAGNDFLTKILRKQISPRCLRGHPPIVRPSRALLDEFASNTQGLEMLKRFVIKSGHSGRSKLFCQINPIQGSSSDINRMFTDILPEGYFLVGDIHNHPSGITYFSFDDHLFFLENTRPTVGVQITAGVDGIAIAMKTESTQAAINDIKKQSKADCSIDYLLRHLWQETVKNPAGSRTSDEAKKFNELVAKNFKLRLLFVPKGKFEADILV